MYNTESTSSKKPDLINHDIEYENNKTSSSFKDTMMHNIRDGKFQFVNTDYHVEPFYYLPKLKDNVMPYSKTEDENDNENDHDNYNDNDNDNNNDNNDYDNKTSSDNDSRKSSHTEKSNTQAMPRQENKTESKPESKQDKYESKFNTANDSVDDAKNKFRQQIGGKVFNSAEEELLAKYDIMRELGEMAHYQGVKLSQNYTLKSNYEDMLRERNLHKYIKDKHEGTKWLSDAFLHLVKGIEWSNQKWNPFGFNLEGWSDHVKDGLKDQYSTFSELYEKYVGQGVSIPPELKLVFSLCSSAAQYHMYNSAIKFLPNLDDAVNKELVQNLREKARAENENMKNYFDDKHEQANNQLRYLQHIKEREREEERESRSRGVYDIDNITEKSAKTQEIRSEKNRLFKKIEELDRLEENVRQMKSSGSVYSKISVPATNKIAKKIDHKQPQKQVPKQESKQVPKQESKQVSKPTRPAPKTDDFREANKVLPQNGAQANVKITPLLEKYSRPKPKIIKSVTLPVATNITAPIIYTAPNQILTRTQPRDSRAPPQIPPVTQNNEITRNKTKQLNIPVYDPNKFSDKTSESSDKTSKSSDKTSESSNKTNESHNKTNESSNSSKTKLIKSTNLGPGRNFSDESSKNTASSNENQSSNNSNNLSKSTNSSKSKSSKIITPLNLSYGPNITNNRVTVLSDTSSSSSNVNKSSSVILSVMDSEHFNLSELSLEHQVTTEATEFINELNNKITNKKRDTKELPIKIPLEGSNSGSSGKNSLKSVNSTQYSGGSVNVIKGRNGKTKKIINIVTKPTINV